MTWNSLKKGKTLSSDDWGISNGIIATLIGQNYSYNSIRMLLECGMSKIQCVKQDIDNLNQLLLKKRSIFLGMPQVKKTLNVLKNARILGFWKMGFLVHTGGQGNIL